MTIMGCPKLQIEVMDSEVSGDRILTQNYRISHLQNRMKCRIIVKYILINTLINNFTLCNQDNTIATRQKLRSMSHLLVLPISYPKFVAIKILLAKTIIIILINDPKTRVLSFNSDFSEINFSKISLAT